MPNYAGYLFLPIAITAFQPGPSYVVVEEELDVAAIAGAFGTVAQLRRKHTTTGRLLAVGADGRALGMRPGDRIVYEAWQGGRWSFRDETREDGEVRCLIMDVSYIELRLIPEEKEAVYAYSERDSLVSG